MFARLLTFAAAAALLSGAASAQDNASPSPAAPATAPFAPAAPAVGPTDSSGYNARAATDATADAATAPPAPAAPASSAALGDFTALKAGDPGVVSNPPVADTPENRARYGQPDSNAGKRSRAHGN